MPVRSLNSSILRWPSQSQVEGALQQWVETQGAGLANAIAIGYFGSYARGNAGKGSDLDVLMIFTKSDLPFHQRSHQWDFLSLPVPVEALIYTEIEWQQLATKQPRFYHTLLRETIWIRPLPGAEE